MVGALFANIIYFKVVDHVRKTDVQYRVLPEERNARDRSITKLGDMCSEAVIGNSAGMFETGHALSDYEEDPTSRASKATKVVLVDNFGWKDVEGELHILETRHGGVVVEILDVKGKEMYIRCVQGAVNHYI